MAKVKSYSEVQVLEQKPSCHSQQFPSKQHNCKFTSENMNDCFDSMLQVSCFSKHHCLLDAIYYAASGLSS